MPSSSDRRVRQAARPLSAGVLVCLLGVVMAACGVSDGTPQATPWEAFEACLEEGGYTIDDVIDGDPLTAEEMEGLGMDPGEAEEARVSEPDYDLDLWVGRCVNESGVGHSVAGDPDDIAAHTEAVLAVAACMHDHGWVDFPDPVPDPAPYSDGLVSGFIEIPQEPEVKEAWTAAFHECSEDAGIPVFLDEG